MLWWGGRKVVRGVTERKSLAHALNAVPKHLLWLRLSRDGKVRKQLEKQKTRKGGRRG